MTQAIAIIPARLNSQRFPRKVLANIAGKSLLRRTYEQVCQCLGVTEVIIAADDELVFRHAQDFGAKVVMTDPAIASGTERIAQAYQKLNLQADIILNVQADEPCFDPAMGTSLVQVMQEKSDIQLLTPICLIKSAEDIFNPSIVKCVVGMQGQALYFSRAPVPYPHKPLKVPGYYRHIGVYCFRKSTLLEFATLDPTPLQQAEDLEQLKLLEHNYPIHVFFADSQCIGVDTPEDVQKVEALLCQTTENMSL